MQRQHDASSRVSTAGIARSGDRYLVALRRPGTSIGESWEFPGGKQMTGETPQETLKREYLEEFSVEIIVGDFICSSTFDNRDAHYRLEAYEIQLISESFVLHEHQMVRWIRLKDLKHLPMAQSDRSILHHLQKQEAERSE